MHSTGGFTVAAAAKRKSRGRRRGFGLGVVAAAAVSLTTTPFFLVPLVADSLVFSVAAAPQPISVVNTSLPPPLELAAARVHAANLAKRETPLNHAGVGDALLEEKDGLFGPAVASEAEEAAQEAQLAEKQKEWEEGRATISVPLDSRPHKNNVDTVELDATMSRLRANSGLPSPKVGLPPTPGQLGYHISNPFRSSEVGPTAKSHRSLGLYAKNYPFTDRSRHLRGQSKPEEADRMRAEMRLPEQASYESLLKHGWTRSQLDDDGKLAVPDERRRPRRESATRRAALLFRKPWWRWTPGAGWVFGVSKDVGPYTRGPGIALANLAPPKEKLAIPCLPLIPNSSKRVLVEMIIAWIVVLTFVALYFEVRAEWRRQAKGKGVARNAPYAGSSSIFVSADPSRSRPVHSRQRSKASLLRGFWQGALVSGASTADRGAKRLHRALTAKTNHDGITALRQDGLPTSGMELLEKGVLHADQALDSIASGSGTLHKSHKASLSPPISAVSLPDDDGYWTSGTGSHSYDLSPRKPGSSRREASSTLSRSSSRSNLNGEDVPNSPVFRARLASTMQSSTELPPVITLHTASPGTASPT